LGIEAEHVRRRLLVEEGGEPTDDFPLIAAFFDALEKLLLACGWDVGLWLCHRSGSIAGKELMSIDQFPILRPNPHPTKAFSGEGRSAAISKTFNAKAASKDLISTRLA
jgi:hypothetical protein